MSAEYRHLRWSVTVADPELWTPEHLAMAETSDQDIYGDWAVDQLRQAMEHAGNAFITDHPDLFRGDLT